jgi:phosphopantothenate synthetase
VHGGVNCADALVCAVAALKAAYETNALALDKAQEPLRSLPTATENSLEKGLAMADAVLVGMERG